MQSTESEITEICQHEWEEVSYDETVTHVKPVSYVMVRGGKVMGKIKMVICSKCALIHQHVVPF